MAVTNKESSVAFLPALVRYTLRDLLAGDVEQYDQNKTFVSDEYMRDWLQRHNPQMLGDNERVKEYNYKSVYSYYTLESFEKLLMCNIVDISEHGVVISLHYSTGEFTMLPLTDKEETAFIQFCLQKAGRPILQLPIENIIMQSVYYG